MTDGWGKEYTAALIGCGRIGYSLGLDKKREQPASHTMALLSHPRIELIAGCDSDVTALGLWKSANKKALVYNNSATLYTRQKPDIVVVAVNEEFHLQEALSAINAKPRLVILEKPVALNLKDALLIRDAAEKNDVPVLINHERRFAEDYRLAKKSLSQIGDLQSITANLYSGLRVYSKKEESTGAYSLLHDGTHLIDIVMFLLEDETIKSSLIQINKQKKTGCGLLGQAVQLKESETKTVSSLLNSPVISGLYKDDNDCVRNVSIHYDTDKCHSVTFNISGRSKYFGFELEILGTTGKICIGNGIFEVYKRTEAKLYSGFYSLEKDKEFKTPKKTQYFSNMIKNAVNFLDGKENLKSSLINGINTMAVIEEIKDLIKN